MEIRTIQPFLRYLDNVRERTLRVARCIPPDKIEWSYAPEKFTLGDLLRHIAVAERYMWAETLQGRPSRYTSHGTELADGYGNVLAFMERLHAESMEIFARLSDEDLQGKRKTPGDAEIPVWKWLRAMLEHEIHHRGQIYIYLGILGVPTPPLYGLTSEEVRARSVAP
ncbi:MAG: DinB family protein [Acidobacteriia bacterium]|nr:DinB family protein [Terriglobia bacterium]